jgi:hypothetical protein
MQAITSSKTAMGVAGVFLVETAVPSALNSSVLYLLRRYTTIRSGAFSSNRRVRYFFNVIAWDMTVPPPTTKYALRGFTLCRKKQIHRYFCMMI